MSSENEDYYDGPFVQYNQNFKWRPFKYDVIDFYGKIHKVNGFFPEDVRKHCAGHITKINGPMVEGLSSWIMHQVVNKFN